MFAAELINPQQILRPITNFKHNNNMNKQKKKLVLAISAGGCHGKTCCAKQLIGLLYHDSAWELFRVYQVKKYHLEPVKDLATFDVNAYLNRRGDCFVLFSKKGEGKPVLAINTMGDKWDDLLYQFYYKEVLVLADIQVIVGACHTKSSPNSVLFHLMDIAQHLDAILITTSPYFKMYPALPSKGHQGPIPNDVVALNEQYAEQQKAFIEKYV